MDEDQDRDNKLEGQQVLSQNRGEAEENREGAPNPEAATLPDEIIDELKRRQRSFNSKINAYNWIIRTTFCIEEAKIYLKGLLKEKYGETSPKYKNRKVIIENLPKKGKGHEYKKPEFELDREQQPSYFYVTFSPKIETKITKFQKFWYHDKKIQNFALNNDIMLFPARYYIEEAEEGEEGLEENQQRMSGKRLSKLVKTDPPKEQDQEQVGGDNDQNEDLREEHRELRKSVSLPSLDNVLLSIKTVVQQELLTRLNKFTEALNTSLQVHKPISLLIGDQENSIKETPFYQVIVKSVTDSMQGVMAMQGEKFEKVARDLQKTQETFFSNLQKSQEALSKQFEDLFNLTKTIKVS